MLVEDDVLEVMIVHIFSRRLKADSEYKFVFVSGGVGLVDRASVALRLPLELMRITKAAAH